MFCACRIVSQTISNLHKFAGTWHIFAERPPEELECGWLSSTFGGFFHYILAAFQHFNL
jgi:hypothetical protein